MFYLCYSITLTYFHIIFETKNVGSTCVILRYRQTPTTTNKKAHTDGAVFLMVRFFSFTRSCSLKLGDFEDYGKNEKLMSNMSAEILHFLLLLFLQS